MRINWDIKSKELERKIDAYIYIISEEDIILDGTFDLDELKTIVREIENNI